MWLQETILTTGYFLLLNTYLWVTNDGCTLGSKLLFKIFKCCLFWVCSGITIYGNLIPKGGWGLEKLIVPS